MRITTNDHRVGAPTPRRSGAGVPLDGTMEFAAMSHASLDLERHAAAGPSLETRFEAHETARNRFATHSSDLGFFRGLLRVCRRSTSFGVFPLAARIAALEQKVWLSTEASHRPDRATSTPSRHIDLEQGRAA